MSGRCTSTKPKLVLRFLLVLDRLSACLTHRKTYLTYHFPSKPCLTSLAAVVGKHHKDSDDVEIYICRKTTLYRIFFWKRFNHRLQFQNSHQPTLGISGKKLERNELKVQHVKQPVHKCLDTQYMHSMRYTERPYGGTQAFKKDLIK